MLGSILQNYSDKETIPMCGFGAITPPKVTNRRGKEQKLGPVLVVMQPPNHCIAMGDFDKRFEVLSGVDGLVAAYKKGVNQLIMDSSLRKFSEVLQKVTGDIVNLKQEDK